MPYVPKSISQRTISALAKIGDMSDVSDPSIDSLDQEEFFRRWFSFLTFEILGMRALLACTRGGHKLDWIVARNLADRTSGLHDVVIVSADSMLSSERLALRAAGLSYIAIDQEIFIPALGANTSARSSASLPEAKLSAATQAVLIHALNTGKCRYEICGLLSQLAIPLKQLGRVSHELAFAGLGAVDRIGAMSYVEMDECSITWAKAEPMLSSPVIDILRIRPRAITGLGQMRVLEEDALLWKAHVRLHPPYRLAVHQRLLKSLRRSLAPSDAESFAEIEIWNRCPARLSPDSIQVDPISLYLCRRSHATLAELGRLRKTISDKWLS